MTQEITIALLSMMVSTATAVVVSTFIPARAARKAEMEKAVLKMLSVWLLPASPEYQATLASLPVVFSKHTKVLRNRDQLLAFVSSEEGLTSKDDTGRKLQAELIEEMARACGHQLSAEELLRGAYLSVGFVDRDNLGLEAANAVVRTADALEKSVDLTARILNGRESSTTGELGEQKIT